MTRYNAVLERSVSFKVVSSRCVVCLGFGVGLDLTNGGISCPAMCIVPYQKCINNL